MLCGPHRRCQAARHPLATVTRCDFAAPMLAPMMLCGRARSQLPVAPVMPLPVLRVVTLYLSPPHWRLDCQPMASQRVPTAQLAHRSQPHEAPLLLSGSPCHPRLSEGLLLSCHCRLHPSTGLLCCPRRQRRPHPSDGLARRPRHRLRRSASVSCPPNRAPLSRCRSCPAAPATQSALWLAPGYRSSAKPPLPAPAATANAARHLQR